MSCFEELGNTVTEPDNTNRAIDTLVIHCSATEYGVEYDAMDIHGWHLDNGWSGIGYHYVITVDGTIQKGRSDDCEGAHAEGYNSSSIGICLIGGLDSEGIVHDNGYNVVQYKTLFYLLRELNDFYPTSLIVGHKELPNVNKACPCLSQTYLDLIRNLIKG